MLPPERKDTTNVDPRSYASNPANPVTVTPQEVISQGSGQQIYAPGEHIPFRQTGAESHGVFVEVEGFASDGKAGEELEKALRGNDALREQLMSNLSSQVTPQLVKEVEALVKEGLSREDAVAKVMKTMILERVARVRRAIKLVFVGVQLAIAALVLYIIYSIVT